MSQLEVNKIVPQTGTSLTYGDNGDTFQIPSGVTLDIASGGTIDATGATITGFDAASDEKVKISSNDTTPGFLNGKLTAGANITLTEGSDGGDETLSIALSGTIPDARFPATLPAASGVNLTALNASNLGSGTVPTARLGSGTASSSTFLAGDQTFKTITGTTINNNADNRLITGSGTANTLEGEANLTFDGSKLKVEGNLVVDAYNNAGEGGGIFLREGFETTAQPSITVKDHSGSAPDGISVNGSDGVSFRTADTERMRIDASGNVGVGTSSPQSELHVNQAAGQTTEIRASAATVYTKIIADDASGFSAIDFSNDLRFKDAGTERARFDSSGHLIPFVSNTYDLGSSSKVWRNIYTSDLNMSNEGLDKGNDVDGTKGSWTFQEGSDDLFLLNNKNGKKYKFKLEECK
jgi:hypothetical protein